MASAPQQLALGLLKPPSQTLDNFVAGRNAEALAVARALATAPQLLLLDEIAGGLTEAECAELVQLMQKIKQTGVTIVWVEHIVHALLAVVSRLAVLNFGRKIIEGEPRSVMASAEVREIYMGIAA